MEIAEWSGGVFIGVGEDGGGWRLAIDGERGRGVFVFSGREGGISLREFWESQVRERGRRPWPCGRVACCSGPVARGLGLGLGLGSARGLSGCLCPARVGKSSTSWKQIAIL
jgi:hypothetical protein